MSLLVRIAAAFAAVALITAAAIAIATPIIVGRGFAQVLGPGPGAGGNGNGPGPMAGLHAQQVQQDTVVALVVIAVVAAAVASIVGVLLARRIVAPLERLRVTAEAVAHGDLGERSGLAGRTDEIGSLGRSFDTMASELEASEEARRRFFQDVVHELKTPLAVIDATSSAVLDGVYDHDDRHIETIRSQSRLLARIVDDLRTISLAEERRLPLRRERTDLPTIAAAAGRDFAARAAEAGVTLRVAVPQGSTALADPDRVQQVVAALVDNALRHTPAGTEVVIEGGPLGSRTRATRGPRCRARHRGGGPCAGLRPLLPGRPRARSLGRDQRARPLDREGAGRGPGRLRRGGCRRSPRRDLLARAPGRRRRGGSEGRLKARAARRLTAMYPSERPSRPPGVSGP